MLFWLAHDSLGHFGADRSYASLCDAYYWPNMRRDHPEATPDYLAMLTQNGIPVHWLQLKEGCICLLICNMSVWHGLVKNARLIVLCLHHWFIEVWVINNYTGQLGDVQFEFTPSWTSWTVHRLQFPLCLSYAMTFNGTQGLTFVKFLHRDNFTLHSPMLDVEEIPDVILWKCFFSIDRIFPVILLIF